MAGSRPTPRPPAAGPPIVAMTVEHWPQVERIYAAGIATGHATFESEPPTWAAFDGSKLPDHRWVAVDRASDGYDVLGWVAASPVSTRAVYAGVVEHSVYVDPSAAGRGIGLRLVRALIRSTESAGIWTIQSSIFRENRASLRLHEHAGFRTVGTRERVARMSHGPLAGTWRDTLLIERRSTTTGGHVGGSSGAAGRTSPDS